eukprot:3542526-Alexandrium_andersonii.AAC.1
MGGRRSMSHRQSIPPLPPFAADRQIARAALGAHLHDGAPAFRKDLVPSPLQLLDCTLHLGLLAEMVGLEGD